VRCGKLGDEAFVGIRLFPAELMIEVSDEKDEAEFLAEFEQHAQQGDGIGSAGDGYSNALARLQQIAIANVMEDLVAHATIVKLSAISRQLSATEMQFAADLRGSSRI
jgi:hypothetical protein